MSVPESLWCGQYYVSSLCRLSSCSIALLILCSSPSDKDMNTVYMNKPATHGHIVWSQRKAKDLMLPVMIRVNITSVFKLKIIIYQVRPLHGSVLISAFNCKIKLVEVEFNEVELFRRWWLYSSCRTGDCGSSTLDFSSRQMYENMQYCTVVAINNLGFSAESAGRGCNSAVCTVDIQLWASLGQVSNFKQRGHYREWLWLYFSGPELFTCCLKLHIKVSSALWPNGCNKKKMAWLP